MTQVNKEDWLLAGLNQLREQGPLGISGEKLARRLDVTRGSFYHHFKNMDAYIHQLMDEWERSYTLTLLENAHADDPAQEMLQLMEAAWNSDSDLEVAIRQWGASNSVVSERIARMDQIRLGHLSRIYSILVNDPEKGRKFGTVAYYGLLGALHATPRLTKADLKALILEIQSLFMTEL